MRQDSKQKNVSKHAVPFKFMSVTTSLRNNPQEFIKQIL